VHSRLECPNPVNPDVGGHLHIPDDSALVGLFALTVLALLAGLIAGLVAFSGAYVTQPTCQSFHHAI
jgi:hypothetical protein